jgi:hypothetical protein
MVLSGKARITGEHYTHRHLWHAAESFRQRGKTDENMGGLLDMAALLFVYFAFEAFLNDLGQRVCEGDWADEKKFFAVGPYQGTLGKLARIAETVNVKHDKSRRPYQTVAELEARRHRLVHGHTETLDLEVRFKHPDSLKSIPAAIYAIAEEPFLSTAFADVESMCDELQTATARQIGERELPGPRAFRGMIGHQGGSIVEMPTESRPPVV